MKNLIKKIVQEEVPVRRMASPFEDLRRQMDALINGFFKGAELQNIYALEGQSFVNPSFEISENEKEFNVTGEIPGLTEKDIEVNVEDNVLTIKGEKKEEKDDKKKNYHLYERRYGSFQRSFYMPDNLDIDKITANLKNGVINIVIPKKEVSKAKTKKIEVKGN